MRMRRAGPVAYAPERGTAIVYNICLQGYHGVGVAVGVPLTLVDFVRPLVVGTSSASIQVAKPVPASPLTVFTSCWTTPGGGLNVSGGNLISPQLAHLPGNSPAGKHLPLAYSSASCQMGAAPVIPTTFFIRSPLALPDQTPTTISGV